MLVVVTTKCSAGFSTSFSTEFDHIVAERMKGWSKEKWLEWVLERCQVKFGDSFQLHNIGEVLFINNDNVINTIDNTGR